MNWNEFECIFSDATEKEEGADTQIGHRQERIGASFD